MDEHLTIEVEQSPSLKDARGRFLGEMCAWAERVISAHPSGITPTGHDGCTFITPWAVYARASGDGRVADFMRKCRDNAKAHFEAAGKWLDGYWRRQEAHHGTEHFDIFLHALWQLSPDDAETVRQFEDAAEHIGNWKSGFPEWYDWRRGVFRSFHLGTEHVGEPSVNVPDHVRFLSLALGAFKMTGRTRYLDLARQYGGRWADAILTAPELPVGLDENGAAYTLGRDQTAYRSFAGAAPDDLSANPPRAENLLASGVPDVMLRLWQLTSDLPFRDAATRITDAAAIELASPIAWQAHAAVRRWRVVTGSDRYDAQVRALAGACVRRIETLTMVPVTTERRRQDAMGLRRDKPDWLDERREPAPSPLLWALCATVTEDEAMMTRAVDLGLAYFRLAQRAFGDEAEHGCGAASLCAVARGHGRLNGAGVVTEVLSPALDSPVPSP